MRDKATSHVRGLMMAACVLLVGCGSPAALDGTRYQIPSENLLSNTTAAAFVRLQYGRSEDPGKLGLVFSGAEVADLIPGYHGTVQGYVGPVDDSPSVVVASEAPELFGNALADNIARLAVNHPLPSYRDTGFGLSAGEGNSFALLDRQGGWTRTDMIPPLCRRNEAGDGGQYDSCTFNVRRKGFNLNFIMSGENVKFADEFVNFVIAKLESWKIHES